MTIKFKLDDKVTNDFIALLHATSLAINEQLLMPEAQKIRAFTNVLLNQRAVVNDLLKTIYAKRKDI